MSIFMGVSLLASSDDARPSLHRDVLADPDFHHRDYELFVVVLIKVRGTGKAAYRFLLMSIGRFGDASFVGNTKIAACDFSPMSGRRLDEAAFRIDDP